MITYNPQKYIVRDDHYESESRKLIDKIDRLYKSDTFFAYMQCSNPAEKLSIVLRKNNEDYTRDYKENYTRFSILMENISWELIEPLTDFESNIKNITSEINPLLEARSYNTNKKSKEKITILENLLIEYGRKTEMPDYITRCRFHNKLNELKRAINTNSLVSYILFESVTKDLERIFEENTSLFDKHFTPVVKQIQLTRMSFDKSRDLISLKEAKVIDDQLLKAEKLISGDSYDDLITASEILSEINNKMRDLSSVKKIIIEENINSQMDSLKKKIWMDDWLAIKNALEILISDAGNTGRLYELNLDKFNIENKIKNKKEEILKFIQDIESEKTAYASGTIDKARNLLYSEASRNDLAQLVSQRKSDLFIKKQTSKDITKDKNFFKHIKFVIYFLLISTLSIVLLINHKKNAVHFDSKGQKYADIIETMIYVQIQKKEKINIVQIRNKILAPPDELKILSADDNEVVISFRNKIYKKSIRKK